MSVSKTARFAVRPVNLTRASGAVRRFVDRITADEPGTRLYATFTSGDDPIEFMHVMVFSDEQAELLHQHSEAVREFVGVLYPVTIDGVRFDDLQLLASTPLRDQ